MRISFQDELSHFFFGLVVFAENLPGSVRVMINLPVPIEKIVFAPVHDKSQHIMGWNSQKDTELMREAGRIQQPVP